MVNQNLRILATVLALGLLTVACSSGTDVDTTVSSTMPDDMEMESETFSFGEPVDGMAPNQTIEVDANDDFTFSPTGLDVSVGDVVTFKVTNTGAIPHDFTLGDEELQDEHEAEMAEMGGNMEMHDEPNSFVLEPGETKEMTWRFTEAGVIIFGCHQVGHYAAGMRGTIVIS